MVKVKVTLANWWGEHKPGDTVTVEEDIAARLLDGGVGTRAEEPKPEPKP